MYLKKREIDVVVLDSLERSSKRALRMLDYHNVPIFRGDIRKTIDVKKAIDKCDAVIHCAAYIDVEESMRKPLIYIDNNVLGTTVIGKVAVDSGIKHIIYLSSAAVYGNPIKLPISENHPINPLSPYGLSKFLGEEILKFFSKQYGIVVTILRLFNVYGPGQTGTYAGVITKFIEKARNKLPLVIYGDGEQTRDFVHVLDVSKAVENVLNLRTEGIFNIGSGKAITINRLAQIIMQLARLDKEPIYEPPRPGDIRHSVADISKAKRLLNYNPSIPLERGLKMLLESTPDENRNY